MSAFHEGEFDLPVAGDVFNLATQTGNDPIRLMREQAAAQLAKAEAREYQERMQLQLAQCPGYVGSDAPTAPGVAGRVVVDPRMTADAVAWLKRRFHVDENLNLSMDCGLCINVMGRNRSKGGGRRVRCSFSKPEQFEFEL